MPSIVITEKPSQAADVRRAVGSKYGEVLPLQGHVRKLVEPEEINPEWADWSPVLLMPPAGRYPWVDDRENGKGERLDKVKAALKTADTVYVAVDADREGDLLAHEVLDAYAKHGTKIYRVIFTAQDPKTLQAAFAAPRAWEEFKNQVEAGIARLNADQVFNLSLTRTASVLLPHKKGEALGVGRVKTPTMAILCQREQDILDFKPVEYFEVSARCTVAGGSFTLRHAPSEKILARASADAIRAAAEGYSGPLSVKVEDKRQGPPKMFDLPSLQKAASSRFGFSAKKTMEVSQALYDAGLITYHRGQARYLNESLVEYATGMFLAVAAHYGVAVGEPVIRTGKPSSSAGCTGRGCCGCQRVSGGGSGRGTRCSRYRHNRYAKHLRHFHQPDARFLALRRQSGCLIQSLGHGLRQQFGPGHGRHHHGEPDG